MLRISRQLFVTAAPAWDVLLEEFFAVGMGESEDAALHASSTAANFPPALMAKSGITKVLVGGSPNGGTAAFSDWWGLLQKSAETKVRPPLCWFMSPRTFGRLFSMDYALSRPLLTPVSPTPTLPAQAHYELLNWPVYVTNSISNSEANGSSTGQSHAILTNPRAIHVGESGQIALAVADQFDDAFEKGQVGLRVGHQIAFDYQPVAAIHVLAGIS